MVAVLIFYVWVGGRIIINGNLKQTLLHREKIKPFFISATCRKNYWQTSNVEWYLVINVYYNHISTSWKNTLDYEEKIKIIFIFRARVSNVYTLRALSEWSTKRFLRVSLRRLIIVRSEGMNTVTFPPRVVSPERTPSSSGKWLSISLILLITRVEKYINFLPK